MYACMYVMWCDVMWCDAMRCGAVWCDVMWCGVVWCGVAWRGVAWCGVVWCGVVWCGVTLARCQSKVSRRSRACLAPTWRTGQRTLRYWVRCVLCRGRQHEAMRPHCRSIAWIWEGWRWEVHLQRCLAEPPSDRGWSPTRPSLKNKRVSKQQRNGVTGWG